MYKILILDDKSSSEENNSYSLLNTLSEQQLAFVDYYSKTDFLWSAIDDGDNIHLLMDFSIYQYIFIHDSYDDPLIDDGLKGCLIQKLAATTTVIFFSGTRRESVIPIRDLYDVNNLETVFYSLKRVQYYQNLKNFIDSILFGIVDLKYLYNANLKPKRQRANDLLENIRTDLEISVEHASLSESFMELMFLLGQGNVDRIIARIILMNDDEFIEIIESLIENNI